MKAGDVVKKDGKMLVLMEKNDVFTRYMDFDQFLMETTYVVFDGEKMTVRHLVDMQAEQYINSGRVSVIEQ